MFPPKSNSQNFNLVPIQVWDMAVYLCILKDSTTLLSTTMRCSRKVLIKGKINNIRATSTRQEVALHLFEVGIMGLLKLTRLCLEVWTPCHESLTSNKPRHLRTPPRRWFTGSPEVCVCVFIIPRQALPSCREDLFLYWAISFKVLKMKAVYLLLKLFGSLRNSQLFFCSSSKSWLFYQKYSNFVFRKYFLF